MAGPHDRVSIEKRASASSATPGLIASAALLTTGAEPQRGERWSSGRLRLVDRRGRMIVEMDADSEPIRGTVSDEQSARSFTGWMQLVTALQATICDTPPEPRGCERVASSNEAAGAHPPAASARDGGDEA